jgi:hypothetical protein
MRHRLAASAALLTLSTRDTAAQSATPLATPGATPVARDLPTEQVAQLTGPPPSINDTAAKWGVDGTDLGSSFLFRDELCIIFGDTFGPNKSDWRSNVMAISTDDDPSDGMTFDRMITDRDGHAKELLAAKKLDFDEITVIPTYGIAVGDRMFLHYMSVKHWGPPGHWELGASGFAYSDDAGETWTKDPDAIWPGDSNFGQVALEEHDGHIYVFGIPGGRYGGVQLARVAPESLLKLDQCAYWTGSAWSDDPASAETIVPPNVGELSVRWNSHYRRWIMMYLNDPAGLIELRTAETITGPWSAPHIAARTTDYPALYAPFQYPKWNDGPDIYFNMSLFGPYQVFLMKTRLPDLMT